MKDRESRLQSLYFENEPYFCPVLGKTVNLTRQAKHHALDKHWEEGDGDGSIMLQRLRDGVSSPNFGTEEDRPLNRRFTLWKERGFSDYPPPSSPYKIGIKPTRLKDEFDVITGYAAMNLQEVLEYQPKETINVQ